MQQVIAHVKLQVGNTFAGNPTNMRLILMFLILVGLSTIAGAGDRVTEKKALVVRGMNADFCDAASIGDGSDPRVNTTTDVRNLSVNCSPDGKISVNDLRKSLPNAHACWTTLEELEKRNSSVVLETDPVRSNKNHCLLRDITPSEMVKALNFKP